MKELRSRYELNEFELKISLSRHVVLDKTWHCDDFCTPFTRLYYVNGGSGVILSGGEEIELEPGFAYLIPSDCLFSSYCKEHLEKLYFHVAVSTVGQYDLLSNIKQICRVPFEQASFDELMRCYGSDDYFDFMKVKMILYKTINDCRDKYGFDKVPIKTYSDTIKSIMEYIHSNPTITLGIKEIADALYLSETKARKQFKAEVGVSIGKYIDNTVFLKARQMLAKEELSIHEISRELDFCDTFYFSRRFKELYKKTPSEYRKMLIMK